MGSLKSDSVLLNGLHYGWLNNLFAYGRQLDSLESVIRQLYHDNIQYGLRAELKQLLTLIQQQKYEIEELSDEVYIKGEEFALSGESDNDNISFGYMLENNRSRDRVRITERSVFQLRYQVSKLLSLAS